MAQLLGMDPDRVLDLAGQLNSQTARLNNVASKITRAANASVSPDQWGIQPGGFVVAPWDIGNVRSAATRVRSAANNIDALASRLTQEANQQKLASEEKAAGAIGKVPRDYFKTPEWLGANWWGATAWMGYIDEFVGKVMDGDMPKTWQWARRQWVNGPNGGYNRYRVGLLQWGNSTYKNNPVAIVRRSIPLSGKWANWAGKIPSWVGKVGRVAGPVGTVIGGGISGYNAWQEQYDKSSDLPSGERELRATAAAVTVGGLNIAGGLAGAAGGAALGAAIGSIFPGPGNVIGGIVGGIIGGVIGSGLGEAAGNWFNSLW